MSTAAPSETADADTADIIELDGPPRAYFEIPVSMETVGLAKTQGAHEIAAIERIEYQSFDFRGDDAKLLAEAVVARVRAELAKYGGGIIWWRRRPCVGYDCLVNMRLATSPSLPAKFWEKLR